MVTFSAMFTAAVAVLNEADYLTEEGNHNGTALWSHDNGEHVTLVR